MLVAWPPGIFRKDFLILVIIKVIEPRGMQLSISWHCYCDSYWVFLFFWGFFLFVFCFCFLSFLGLLPQHMEVPRLGSTWSCSHLPTPEPQQHQIRTTSATYTTAHNNVRSWTHWARPGMETTASWFLVGFVNHCTTAGTPKILTVVLVNTSALTGFLAEISLKIWFKKKKKKAMDLTPK